MLKRFVSMIVAAITLVSGLSILGTAPAVANTIVTVSVLNIPVPVTGQSPATSVPSGVLAGVTQWATPGGNTDIRWIRSSDRTIHTGNFQQGVRYGALVVLDAAAGYTFNGVTSSFFTVVGSSYIYTGVPSSYSGDRAEIEVEFPVTVAPVLTAQEIEAARVEAVRVAALQAAEALAAVQAAIAAGIAKAKATLVDGFKGGKPASVEQYRAADFKVNNSRVAEKVNAAVLKLPLVDRESVSRIVSILKVENFIDQLSTAVTHKRFNAKDLVDLGLVEETNPNKTSVANALKRADAESLDSIEKIKQVIAAELAAVAARKDRLAAIKAKMAARN